MILNFDYPLRVPVSKYSHIGDFGFNIWIGVEGHNPVHNMVTAHGSPEFLLGLLWYDHRGEREKHLITTKCGLISLISSVMQVMGTVTFMIMLECGELVFSEWMRLFLMRGKLCWERDHLARNCKWQIGIQSRPTKSQQENGDLSPTALRSWILLATAWDWEWNSKKEAIPAETLVVALWDSEKKTQLSYAWTPDLQKWWDNKCLLF